MPPLFLKRWKGVSWRPSTALGRPGKTKTWTILSPVSGKIRGVSLKVVKTPEAMADLALQADYYAEHGGIRLAERFGGAVKAAIRLLAD